MCALNRNKRGSGRSQTATSMWGGFCLVHWYLSSGISHFWQRDARASRLQVSASGGRLSSNRPDALMINAGIHAVATKCHLHPFCFDVEAELKGVVVYGEMRTFLGRQYLSITVSM